MTIAVIVHVIGTVLGVGGVTVNDLMLLRAIGDGDLGVAYQKSVSWYSGIIWIGLILLIGSAVSMALSNDWVLHSSKVLIKIILVGILTTNGLLMNLFLTPRLQQLRRADWEKKTDRLQTVLLQGVFPGALSLASWYTTLILGAAGKQPWTIEQMSLGFLAFFLLMWAAAYLIVRQRLTHST